MIAFGPVPSRRLGRSLGVNGFLPKHCTYPCTCCQVGPTRRRELRRRMYHRRDLVVDELRRLGVPLAVIANGSLRARPDVRRDLTAAALVSVKIDTTEERTWRRLSRPHPALDLTTVLDGIRAFAAAGAGPLDSLLAAGSVVRLRYRDRVFVARPRRRTPGPE